MELENLRDERLELRGSNLDKGLHEKAYCSCRAIDCCRASIHIEKCCHTRSIIPTFLCSGIGDILAMMSVEYSGGREIIIPLPCRYITPSFI